jgi:hypothetical protein
MVTKKFNVRDGLKAGSIVLDSVTGKINAVDLDVTNKVSALELSVDKVSSNIIPKTNNTYDIGEVAKKFKDLYLAGNINVGTQTISATATGLALSGTLEVTTANVTTVNATTINTTSLNTDVATVNEQLVINSTIDATSTDTGSIVTAGGVGIMKDLYVGGAIHLANGLGGTGSKGKINYNDGVDSIDFNFNG